MEIDEPQTYLMEIPISLLPVPGSSSKNIRNCIENSPTAPEHIAESPNTQSSQRCPYPLGTPTFPMPGVFEISPPESG